jgi:hypothetical protein
MFYKVEGGGIPPTMNSARNKGRYNQIASSPSSSDELPPRENMLIQDTKELTTSEEKPSTVLTDTFWN